MPVTPEAWPLNEYALLDTASIITPALLIYPDKVCHNIQATLDMLDGDANRWRPHIKTAKLQAVLDEYIRHGISIFKCATTLELKTACQAGSQDVLIAISVVGANAIRVKELASAYPATRISVLIESASQLQIWRDSSVGVYLDLNSGMNRTGIDPFAIAEMIELARSLGIRFRGLHWYDGHVSMPDATQRREIAFSGYDHLMKIVKSFSEAGIAVAEVITSGTPAAPYGHAYPQFNNKDFVHRISPGTVIYNDLSSLQQLPDYGYVPAALVLSTVISHPRPGVVTCDAGHKAVSVDSGVPNCQVVGHADMTPQKPSEEHLPISVSNFHPKVGEKLYLLPKHICPTVNNFDHALMVRNGMIERVEAVTARGHDYPIALAEHA